MPTELKHHMGNGAGPTQIGSGDLRVPTLRAKIMRWLAPESLPAGSGREVLDNLHLSIINPLLSRSRSRSRS